MKQLRWNEFKNIELKIKHGISFNEIIKYQRIDLIEHPRRLNQFIMLFVVNDYVWVVPCVLETKGWFLKTLYPSRKFTKVYGGKYEKN